MAIAVAACRSDDSPISRISTAPAAGRSAGSLARHSASTEPSSPGTAVRFGSSRRTRLIVMATVPAANGETPVAANTMVAAQANTSAAGPGGEPPSCSGAW
nr:hypothetical protein GCM10020093_103160 [Planobispora longispora]